VLHLMVPLLKYLKYELNTSVLSSIFPHVGEEIQTLEPSFEPIGDIFFPSSLCILSSAICDVSSVQDACAHQPCTTWPLSNI
jgi:hypothetical protein